MKLYDCFISFPFPLQMGLTYEAAFNLGMCCARTNNTNMALLWLEQAKEAAGGVSASCDHWIHRLQSETATDGSVAVSVRSDQRIRMFT